MMKNYITSWKLWATIAVALAVILVFRTNSLVSILPLSLVLICPIMMMFMMGGNKHK